MNIYQKLLKVQAQLKVPKGQFNKFGNFSYRNLEDIVEGVKPLLAEYNLALTLSDTVKQIGDRFYIEATAILVNAENPEETIITTAMAREAATKKGMDDSQITGASSSYARKYCLNGLFSIDDTKDADTQPPNNQKTSTQNNQKPPAQNNNNKPTPTPQGLNDNQLQWLSAYCQRKGYTDNATKQEFMKFYGFSPRTTSPDEFMKIQQQIEADERGAVAASPF